MSMIQLFHGTDMAGALDIVQTGLDEAKAAVYNGGGEFWATTDLPSAEWFAKASPGGSPALVLFDIPEALLQILLNSPAKSVFAHATSGRIDYEFLPASYAEVNRAMTNKNVIVLP